MQIKPLAPDALYRRCDPEEFEFETTADLEDLAEFIGQPRAVDAVRFGIGIRRNGYNLFALGAAGTGKHSLVRLYVEEQAATEAVPADWCYVNHFEQEHKPRVLRLPSGKCVELRRDMEQLIEELGSAIPAIFESDEYRTRSESIEQALNERQEQAVARVQEKAHAKGIAVLRTPTGFTLAPMRDDEPLDAGKFEKLPKDERKQIEADIQELHEELHKTMRKAPQWQKERRQKLDELNREMAVGAVSHRIEALREKYRELSNVKDYLDALETDVIGNFRMFLPKEQEKASLLGIGLTGAPEGMSWSNRYRINTLRTDDTNGGAPVIYEDNPTYNNLIGRVEHRAQFGALITDFTMIRAGALHRANGGYLMLDARKVLTQPFAWEALKRALKSGEVRLESLAQIISLISTVSLEPEPIPLDVKVILLGEPIIYYLLSYLDPEFEELFKVQVDFDNRMDRLEESTQLYAQLIGTLARKEDLRPFHRSAVARVVEQSARLVEDSEKLATHMRSITDLLCESDYWAGQRRSDKVNAQDVQRAIDTRIHRADRLRARVQEEIRRGTILIDTQGKKIGQINGLSVVSIGGFSFGHPTRITARVRIGEEQVVDIEREVEMGGPIHSKGVLILSHFLGARYALNYPLSLSASLVFEQSYGGVEGDSASSAELYALLSALAELPIMQSLAVTGSVNQRGEVQAIGGINEKIEGFFDICQARGLSGEQGVLIPASNVKHLMLRHDLVEAVAAGKFSVYAVKTIDEGIELLTGIAAGERDKAGRFPDDSVNQRVEEKLIGYSERMRDFAASQKKSEGKEENPL
ncbi:MAG: AAA family ATPase [Halobacteria archaeon]|nr:AAA family ATPase [Halobacteria archaeon]